MSSDATWSASTEAVLPKRHIFVIHLLLWACSVNFIDGGNYLVSGTGISVKKNAGC